jgi:hypothetical protein
VPKPQPIDTSFGAGCFVLSPKHETTFDITGAQYLEQVSQTLACAQGVGNISTAARDYFKVQTYSLHGPLPRIHEAPTIFPPGDVGLWITFSLHILHRVQTELIGEEWEQSPGPEDFIVTMTPGYFGPATFVEPVNPPPEYPPSSAVKVAREYLNRELADNPKALLRFESLGPSPFHAEFNLKAFIANGSNEPDRPSDWNVLSKYAGYEELTLTYNPAAFRNLDAARIHVFQTLKEQLGIAYMAIQEGQELEHDWHVVAAQVSALVEMHEARGVRPFVIRTLRVPQSILQATLSLANYEMSELGAKQRVKEAFDAEFDHTTHPCLRDQVQEYVDGLPEAPVDQFQRLVSMFDRYRSERLSGLTVILSAIIGGVVGSLLTILLSHH